MIVVLPLDILMKRAYVLFLLLDMSKFKSWNKFTDEKLKKYLGIEKDTGKVNYSQLLMG